MTNIRAEFISTTERHRLEAALYAWRALQILRHGPGVYNRMFIAHTLQVAL